MKKIISKRIVTTFIVGGLIGCFVGDLLSTPTVKEVERARKITVPTDEDGIPVYNKWNLPRVEFPSEEDIFGEKKEEEKVIVKRAPKKEEPVVETNKEDTSGNLIVEDIEVVNGIKLKQKIPIEVTNIEVSVPEEN